MKKKNKKIDPIFIRAADRKIGKAAHGKFTIKETILGGGRIPYITQIAVSTLRLGKTEPKPHRHPTMWEIYFVLKGKATHQVGKKKYKVAPGDFLAVPPNMSHNQIVTKAPHVVYYFGIATDGKVRGEVKSAI